LKKKMHVPIFILFSSSFEMTRVAFAIDQLLF